VLSERYGAVTVLDRDGLPTGGTPRRGVPQGGRPHVLLVSGLYQLAALFPGIADDLIAAGASRFDPGLWLPRVPDCALNGERRRWLWGRTSRFLGRTG
jgi:hypothetical protein